MWVSQNLSLTACRRPFLQWLERTTESDMTNCSPEYLAASPLVLLCQDALINYLANTDSLYFRHETRHPKTNGKDWMVCVVFFPIIVCQGLLETECIIYFLQNIIAGKSTPVCKNSFLLFLVWLLEKQTLGFLYLFYSLPRSNCSHSSNCSKQKYPAEHSFPILFHKQDLIPSAFLVPCGTINFFPKGWSKRTHFTRMFLSAIDFKD